MVQVSDDESRMIRVLRVLCIFFMMSVHLNPKLSIFSTGSLSLVSDFWVHFLGRASVAALSFVGGYLIFPMIDARRTQPLLLARSRALLVPMMTWNAIHLCFILFALYYVGVAVRPDTAELLNWNRIVFAVTGLTGEPAIVGLLFLRDMFVASLLIAVTWPILKQMRILALVGTSLIFVFNALEPVIFRPEILLFLLAGCVARSYGVTLLRLSRSDVVMWVTVGSMAALAVFWFFVPDGSVTEQVCRLLKRVGAMFMALWIAARLIQTRVYPVFRESERGIYLAFLSHTTLFSVALFCWREAGFSYFDPAFVVFFFLMPVVAILGGLVLRKLVDVMPDPFPTLLAGRKRHTRSVATSEPAPKN